MQGLLLEEATRKFPPIHQPLNLAQIPPLARDLRVVKSKNSVARIKLGAGLYIVRVNLLLLKEHAIPRIKVLPSNPLLLLRHRIRSLVTHSLPSNASLRTSSQRLPFSRLLDQITSQSCLVPKGQRPYLFMPLFSSPEPGLILVQIQRSIVKQLPSGILGYLGTSTTSCLTWEQ